MDEMQKAIKELFGKYIIKIYISLKKVPLTKYQMQHLAFILSLKAIGFTNEEIIKMINHGRE